MARANVLGFISSLSSICLLVSACAAYDGHTYRDLAVHYADRMIQDGRDTYGSQSTPLFATTLDRFTYQLFAAEPPAVAGMRSRDRAWRGANPAHHMQLYELLYRLTEDAGEARYADEADAALTWFVNHTRSSVTHLLAWGEHLYWDFTNEKAQWYIDPSGFEVRYHEFFEEQQQILPHLFALSFEAAKDFALGLWDHQVHDQTTGEYDRHAAYDRHGTATKNPFPRVTGHMVRAWANAYHGATDPDVRQLLLTAINRLIDYQSGRRWHGTQALSWARESEGGPDEDAWQHKNSVLMAIEFDHALAESDLPESERSKIKQQIDLTDDVILNQAHHPLSIDQGFRFFGRTSKVNADAPGYQPYSLMWDVGYAVATTARYALLHHRRFEQTGNPAYLSHVIGAADLYRHAELPDMAQEYSPDAFAHAINLLVVAYESTEDTRYLDRANVFGRIAIDQFTAEDSDLPKASNRVEHYEALTGGDDLMLAFYRLHMALVSGNDSRPWEPIQGVVMKPGIPQK